MADQLGVAVNGQGVAEANMGIAFGDTDGNILPDIMITHFFGEHDTLWCGYAAPEGGIFYQDQTNEAGLAIDSRHSDRLGHSACRSRPRRPSRPGGNQRPHSP